MRRLEPNEMNPKDHYKFLIGSIVPRPIAFVTSLSEDNVLNGAPYSYFNIVSSNPPRISLSVQRKNGEQKDTARNIQQKKEFVVHIADESYVEQMNESAAPFPHSESEIEATGLTPVKSTKISVPGVKEARVRFECVLEKSIGLDGPAGEICDLLIGRIVQYHIQDDLYENGRIDADKLRPVSRLAGDDYMRLGEMFTIERPR